MTVLAMDLDYCRRCGGIWFDRWGFDALRISGEERDIPLTLTVKPAGFFEAVAESADNVRRCPACEAKMAPHAVEIKDTLVFDRCSVCTGIWADELVLDRVTELVAEPAMASASALSPSAISTYNSIDSLSEAQAERACAFAQLCAAVVQNPQL